MKKLLFGTSLAATVFLTAVVIETAGCTKTNDTPPVKVCDVKGFYTGTNLSKGVSSTVTYDLRENNFAVGGVTAGTSPVTFGGYTNTCDSVILSVYYTGNGSYYLLKGKLSNENKTISGSFNNLTNTSDFGTFTMTK